MSTQSIVGSCGFMSSFLNLFLPTMPTPIDDATSDSPGMGEVETKAVFTLGPLLVPVVGQFCRASELYITGRARIEHLHTHVSYSQSRDAIYGMGLKQLRYTPYNIISHVS